MCQGYCEDDILRKLFKIGRRAVVDEINKEINKGINKEINFKIKEKEDTKNGMLPIIHHLNESKYF